MKDSDFWRGQLPMQRCRCCHVEQEESAFGVDTEGAKELVCRFCKQVHYKDEDKDI